MFVLNIELTSMKLNCKAFKATVTTLEDTLLEDSGSQPTSVLQIWLRTEQTQLQHFL
jgi:hypothetical protein